MTQSSHAPCKLFDVLNALGSLHPQDGMDFL